MADSANHGSRPLDNYALDDRYRRSSGRVFLTGTQALVKLPLMQRAMDRAAGLNTAGFISGYRGSPLGAYDQELWRARSFLEDSNIEFCRRLMKTWRQRRCTARSKWKPTRSARSMAYSVSGTARAPASTGPAMR